MRARAAALLLAAALAGGLAGLVADPEPESVPARRQPAPVPSGGVLHLLSEQAYPSLDPARLLTARQRDVGRLLYRSLTTYAADGVSTVPDLAAAPGVPSRGGRVWTYALRPDARYADGTAVVAADVVRGVARALRLKAPTGGATVTAAGDAVVLTFAQPFADADAVATLPAFAPVPRSGVQPTGPYTVAAFSPGTSFRLVRNPAYAGDDVVRAQPDEIDAELGLDGATIDRRLAQSAGSDAYAVTDKAQLEPSTVPTRAVVHGPDASVLFTALDTLHGPFTDLKVRQAFEVAFPLARTRAAAGGPVAGDYASDVLPPYLDAHVDDDAYGQKRSDRAGDPRRAKRMLLEAGYADGVALTTVVPSTSAAAADALVAGLAPAGFRLSVRTVAPAAYYATVAALRPDLAGFAWAPDWLAPSAYLPPLFTCSGLTAAYHCDRTFDAQVRAASAALDPDAATRLWQALDTRLVQEAAVVPRFYGTATSLVGSGVGGARATLAWGGAVDLANVTVR